MNKTNLLLFVIIFFNSCIQTRVIDRTHTQYMNSFKTKDQIINAFGLPDIKKEEGEFEEWYFDKGRITKTSGLSLGSGSSASSNSSSYRSNWLGGVSSNGNGKSTANSIASFSSVSDENKKYVKFIFKDKMIIKWDTKGVDYTTYKK